MQVLVMYYSRTGNTKKLAEEIAKGVQQVEEVKCATKPVSEVTKDDFVNSDGIIAGSPVYFGAMAAEMKEVFDKFVGIRGEMEDKIGAAFATSGDPSGGKETTIFSHYPGNDDIRHDHRRRPFRCNRSLRCVVCRSA